LISENTDAISGQLVWWQLLEGYLDREAGGDKTAARRYFDALSYAGDLQAQKTGDRFIVELVSFYRSTSFKEFPDLLRAHTLVNQAHVLLSKSETDRALSFYKRAANVFVKTGNSLENRFATYWIGYCYYRQSAFEESLSVLSQLAEFCRARRYLWLLQKAVTAIGGIHVDSNEFSIGIRYQTEALRISEEINDIYNVQKNLTMLAYGYKNLGNQQQSFSYLKRCLDSTEACWPGARQMYRNYDTAAGIVNSFGYRAAAAEYEKGALRIALEEAQDPSMIHLSYVHLGAIYAKSQNIGEALSNSERSYQIARTIPDERTSVRATGHSLLQLGQTHREARNYTQAIAYFDEAINLYESIGLFAFLYEAHKGRLLCYLAQADDPSAERELETVLMLFEEHRAKVREESNRNSFFDLEQYVYDIAIDFEYSRDHYQRAFEYSEASRARSLLDLMSVGTRTAAREGSDPAISPMLQPLMLGRINEDLPDECQILQYSVLEDKLLIWVIAKGKLDTAERGITSASLTDKVTAYWQSVSNPAGDVTGEARRKAIELYQILIEPVESYLTPKLQICVIPDKVLNRVPFNALVSPSTQQYFIQDHLLSFAPSSNAFLVSSRLARDRAARKDETALIVGAPSFSRTDFPDLLELSSSRVEAERIAQCYKGASCLIGRDATKQRVQSGMEKCDVIHLASHFVLDKQDSMFSKLLLAPPPAEGSDTKALGTLQTYEIHKENLPSARLVVLAACQTGFERYYRGEGMIGMSRSFLIAGVPLVIGSLWPVASDSTADLMVAFHKYRTSGNLSSARALRRAQLDMINNPSPLFNQPNCWAPFILLGGFAQF